jgi:hypothetical protein
MTEERFLEVSAGFFDRIACRDAAQDVGGMGGKARAGRLNNYGISLYVHKSLAFFSLSRKVPGGMMAAFRPHFDPATPLKQRDDFPHLHRHGWT